MTLEITLNNNGQIDHKMKVLARSLNAMNVKGSELAETGGKITIHCQDSDCDIARGVVERLDMVKSVELRV